MGGGGGGSGNDCTAPCTSSVCDDFTHKGCSNNEQASGPICPIATCSVLQNTFDNLGSKANN